MIKESVLRLQNVEKYYISETSVTQALRKVNLSFALGEFVAVTGESGSGKSTLLNGLSGIDIIVADEPTGNLDQENSIEIILHDGEVISDLDSIPQEDTAEDLGRVDAGVRGISNIIPFPVFL